MVLGALFALTSCATRGTETRVASALDALARVVDPAYGFAVDACVTKQTLIADATERKELTHADGTRQLSEVREKCRRARVLFDAIRRTHDEARDLVERGQIEAAEKKLAAIISMWADLREETGS